MFAKLFLSVLLSLSFATVYVLLRGTPTLGVPQVSPREIEAHGASKIPDRIKAEVKAGFCACEVKNPAGSCCLGDVNRVAMDLRRLVFATGL